MPDGMDVRARCPGEGAMIHYQLRCTSTAEEHLFDSWFKDSAAFEALAQAGMVECPVCGGTKVSRALMTPAIARKDRLARELPAPAPSEAGPVSAPGPAGAPPAPVASGPMPAQLRAMLQRLRAEIERHCEYVGREFAKEARRMHYGETKRRGIFGEATDAEAEALRDEGIEVARIPWVPRSDA